VKFVLVISTESMDRDVSNAWWLNWFLILRYTASKGKTTRNKEQGKIRKETFEAEVLPRH